MSSENNVHRGSCFCGAVEFTVTGAPRAMGYCHCESCRRWSASPVNAFSLWPPEALRVITGVERIGMYHQTERSHRQFCTACGGHLFTAHPLWKLVDVYVAVLPDLEFVPQVHVNYQSTVLPMKDGLPKFSDFPREMGGSGVTIAE